MCEQSSYPYSESFMEMMSTCARDVNDRLGHFHNPHRPRFLEEFSMQTPSIERILNFY